MYVGTPYMTYILVDDWEPSDTPSSLITMDM